MENGENVRAEAPLEAVVVGAVVVGHGRVISDVEETSSSAIAVPLHALQPTSDGASNVDAPSLNSSENTEKSSNKEESLQQAAYQSDTNGLLAHDSNREADTSAAQQHDTSASTLRIDTCRVASSAPLMAFPFHPRQHSSNYPPPPYAGGDGTIAPSLSNPHHSPPLAALGETASPSSPNAMILFYEAQMRDHAVAYASAAAGAAWAAAQVANQAMEYVAVRHGLAPPLVAPPPQLLQQLQQQQHTVPHPPPPFHPPCAPSFAAHHSFRPHHAPPIAPAPGAYAPVSPFALDPSMSLGSFSQPPPPLPHYPLYGGLTPQHQHHHLHQGDADHGTLHQEVRATLNPPGGGCEDDRDGHSHHPRKRQQRLPPPDHSKQLALFDIPRAQQRDKVRRRLRSDNDSSSSGSSWMRRSLGGGNNTNAHATHNASAQSIPASNEGHHRSSRQYHHSKKKKTRSDDSLLGKTGVAALFEWCSKRPHQPTPTFELDQNSALGGFECVVYLEPDRDTATGEPLESVVRQEWGRGHGLQKSSAKQAAARRALQALLPGAMFDEETGILIDLPLDDQTATAYHLEELAPNLAKQLAIGRDVFSTKAEPSRVSRNVHDIRG
jgi:hypothetical protein